LTMDSSFTQFIPESIQRKYDLYNFNHAVEILALAYPDEWNDLVTALDHYTLSIADILAGGGSESDVPKKMSTLMYPKGWHEVMITADLYIKLTQRSPHTETTRTIEDFIAGHNIDYVKNDVAFDFEWNSKDQTFDRDLFALRTFYECGIIKVGIIVTRSEKLNPVFFNLGIRKKYGASTTWMGKLLPRIRSGRHGGLPLFVVGITPAVFEDLE